MSVNHEQGLSSEEAASRLNQFGPNELPCEKRRNAWQITYDVSKEPMSLLLLIAGLIYFILGDLNDAAMLMSFVVLLLGLTIYQQNKAERALDALREMSSPRALVIRDGKPVSIPGIHVVPDDLAFIKEGDRVPADGVLISSLNLQVDESILTGESAPVRKFQANHVMAFSSPGNNHDSVYSGTLVTQGQGTMKVIYTGAQTEMGKIGKAIQSVPIEKTFLKLEMERLVKYFTVAGVIICVLILVIYGITRGHWLEAVLAGITFSMAIIPEEFPVIFTIFMALGAWRLSKQQILVRQIPAVETLGEITVLCVDKTGTITENRMVVKELVVPGDKLTINFKETPFLPEAFHTLVEYSILASQRNPFDPMEKAFHQLGECYLAQTEHIHRGWQLIREYPLSKELLAMSLVWRSEARDIYTIAAKGAPEAIMDLCHMTSDEMARVTQQVSGMAACGLRIIAVAKAIFKPVSLPPIQHDFDFEFVGLIGLQDPVRPTAKEAIQKCYQAGIRIIMITGDYPATAQSIAKEVGLAHTETVVSGETLRLMSDTALQAKIEATNLFARMIPEQKLRLVNALKANGEIVAMTGDGVNDAPALKAANVGLAMGEKGSDVAREAAGIVLLKDDLSSIVGGIERGRGIFDNIRKAVAYILAIHIPIAGLSLIPVLLGWPLILLPVHIALLQLVIDPACSIVFEAEPLEANIMSRPPRPPKSPLLSKSIGLSSILQGISIFITIFLIYSVSQARGLNIATARALAFTTFFTANLALIISNRSSSHSFLQNLVRPNPALKWVTLGTLVLVVLVLFLPYFSIALEIRLLSPLMLVMTLLLGIICVLWLDLFKLVLPRKSGS